VEVVVTFTRLIQPQGDVVREDGEQVYGVERSLEELQLAGRRPQPDDVLEREPGDARSL